MRRHPEDIHTWAHELLKDEYRGRRSGDVGYDKAVTYVIDHLEMGPQADG